MWTAIMFVLGVILGCVFATVKKRVKSVGAIRIDMTDPDGLWFFLEVDKGKLDVLMAEKYVMVRTYFKKSTSQK